MAPAIRPFDSGEAISALTAIDPADSPAMVTFFGSPPNAAMFCCTHCERRVLIEQARNCPRRGAGDSFVSSGWAKNPKTPRR